MQKIKIPSLEDLEQILKLLAAINNKLDLQVDKRWLTTKEVAKYSGYALETIKSYVKNNGFLQDIHYFKRNGKLLFDKYEIDKWIMGIDLKNNNYLGLQLSDEAFGTEYDKYLEQVLE